MPLRRMDNERLGLGRYSYSRIFLAVEGPNAD